MKKSLLKTVLFLVAVLGYSNAIAGQAASQEYNKANRLFSEGKYSDALAVYQRVLAAHPGEAAAGKVQSRIGDCHFQLHDYQSALHAYRGALPKQNDSERPPTQYWIGFCTFLLGNDKDAVAEFLKIPKRYPSSGMWVGTAYYWAGRACERMGDKAKAAEYYRKAGGKGSTTQGRFAIKKAEAVSK
jgi:TolA-binding protein